MSDKNLNSIDDYIKIQERISKNLQPNLDLIQVAFNVQQPTVQITEQIKQQLISSDVIPSFQISDVIKQNFEASYKNIMPSTNISERLMSQITPISQQIESITSYYSKIYTPSFIAIREAIKVSELIPKFEFQFPNFYNDDTTKLITDDYIDDKDTKEAISNLVELSKKKKFTTDEKEKIIESCKSLSFSVSDYSNNKTSYLKANNVHTNASDESIKKIYEKFQQKIPSISDPDFYFQQAVGQVINLLVEGLKYMLVNQFDVTSFMFVFGITIFIFKKKNK